MGQAVEKLMDTEIFFVRCSMCPNGPGADRICPPGYLDKEESICRFTNSYTDQIGQKYKVIQERAFDIFQLCRQAPEGKEWIPLNGAENHDNFDDAQEELNRIAAFEEWNVY